MEKKNCSVERKFFLILLGAVCIFGVLNVSAKAQTYPLGAEGIKAASVPPPGVYYRMYTMYYRADRLQDAQGHRSTAGSSTIDLDIAVLANAHRLIWISGDITFLGAAYGADLMVPVLHKKVEMTAGSVELYDDTATGPGDIMIEPVLLSWHRTRYDLSAGVGFFLPTGEENDDALTDPGEGLVTTMFTLGGTYYLNREKSWSASLLARYEIHFGDRGNSGITPGNDFQFEWGIGYSLCKTIEVGLAGYAHWQVTEDEGGSTKDSVYAFGPEISVMLPGCRSFLSLRSAWEFGAEDRPEGNIATLTLTRMF